MFCGMGLEFSKSCFVGKDCGPNARRFLVMKETTEEENNCYAVIITIYVLVVYMAGYIMVLRQARISSM